jgi:hypothetical protein
MYLDETQGKLLKKVVLDFFETECIDDGPEIAETLTVLGPSALSASAAFAVWDAIGVNDLELDLALLAPLYEELGAVAFPKERAKK